MSTAMEVVRTPVAELSEHARAQEQARVLTAMLSRSAVDRAFRRLLLEDPHAACAQAGLEVAPTLDIRFVENEHDATIVLPDPIDDMLELSEAELAQFNGGSDAEVAISILSSVECFVGSAIISALSVLVSVLSHHWAE